MANPERGERRITIAGRDYILRLTTNAACELEERSGKTTADLVMASNLGSIVAARWLMWGYLQDHHGAVIKTPIDAGKLIDEAGGLDVINEQLDPAHRLNEAPAAFAGNGKGDADRPPDAQPVSTGDDSISTPASSG